jgi:hypothetical protein
VRSSSFVKRLDVAAFSGGYHFALYICMSIRQKCNGMHE